MTAPPEQDQKAAGGRQVRASQVVRAGPVWLLPLVAGSVLVMLMTLIYFGSIVDPASHLHGLPVSVVNEDVGASTPAGKVNVGRQVIEGLTNSAQVSHRLSLHVTTLATAEARMNRGADYAAMVIPAGFTASILTVGGTPGPAGQASTLPTIELLTNSRAGTLGVSLASGVLQPAVAAVSSQIGHQLVANQPTPGSPALQAFAPTPSP